MTKKKIKLLEAEFLLRCDNEPYDNCNDFITLAFKAKR